MVWTGLLSFVRGEAGNTAPQEILYLNDFRINIKILKDALNAAQVYQLLKKKRVAQTYLDSCWFF